MVHTPEAYFNRAAILWTNAHRMLGALKVAEGRYRKPKRMREACGTGWLAVQEAIKGLARRRGALVKKLPKEIDQLGQELDESHVNGRAMAELEDAYQLLHIAGYYEGVRSASQIALGMDSARSLVERITKAKLPRRA